MSESVAYAVKNKRLSLDVAILNINSLRLHEETILELLEHLAVSIKADGVVKHPIIVDKESLIVLDGVHRVAALRKLGIKRVPACLIDYKNPNIKVCSWYRTISDASAPERILKQIEQLSNVVVKSGKFDEDLIGVSPTVAAIKFKNKTFLINSQFQNLIDAFHIVGRIEERLKAAGFRVRYETELDSLENLRRGRVDAVLCTARLSKEEIFKAALSGQVFASKATRHVIPARLMNLNVPLNLIRDDKRPLSEVNEELSQMLMEKRLRRVPSGSVFEGRRYEEELYVFED